MRRPGRWDVGDLNNPVIPAKAGIHWVLALPFCNRLGVDPNLELRGSPWRED